MLGQWGVFPLPTRPGRADTTPPASAPTAHDATIRSVACKHPSVHLPIQYLLSAQDRPGTGLNGAHSSGRTIMALPTNT